MGIEHVGAFLDAQFKDVQGWCSPHLWNVIQPIHDFQVKEGVRGPVAEIGVFQGKFFIGLALTKKGEGRHTAFDVFDMQRFNLDGAGRGNLDIFRANLATAGLSEDETDIRRVDSMTLSQRDIEALRERGLYSMFSVDGCHMVEHTINDFRIAMQLTDPGGVIFVDDYLNPDWPGVQEGLARLYLNDSPRFVPVAYLANKLVTCHISYARELVAHLKASVKALWPSAHTKMVRRFGYDCLNVRPDMTGGHVKIPSDEAIARS